MKAVWHLGWALAVAGWAAASGPAVEPFTYREDFEGGAVAAWASYPSWQDTAYDPNLRVGAIEPGNANRALVQTVTPFAHADQYAGVVKEFDAFLDGDSRIALRVYLKTHLPVEWLVVRIAAGPWGTLDARLPRPATNAWVELSLSRDDFHPERADVAVPERVPVHALAVLAKVPGGDPAMPIQLGVDDVSVEALRPAAFAFSEPRTHKLAEWPPHIADRAYAPGDTLTVRGRWPFEAAQTRYALRAWPDGDAPLHAGEFAQADGGAWSLALPLEVPPGMYRLRLGAVGGQTAETELSIRVAPPHDDAHPRLWFDAEGLEAIRARLATDRFKPVADRMRRSAERARTELPLEATVFDMDQFPDEDWIPSLTAWFARITGWGHAIRENALLYATQDDAEAGAYAKALMLRVAEFPTWLHPWMATRGQPIYYPVGEFGMDYAMGYDLLHGLMSEPERGAVRAAMWTQVVEPCHRGYVVHDLVTSNTSNWVAHITGGSLMAQAAMHGDGGPWPEEPYLTGALLKNYALAEHAIGRDGSYGEGYSYYNFTMKSWARSMPAVERVYGIDLSSTVDGSYRELAWAGNAQKKEVFYFGDSGGALQPLVHWAWLLPKYRDPLLGWLYHHLKEEDTWVDVLYDTDDVPREPPFSDNPVRHFRGVGTMVFKSGWEPDAFIFVMRAGPFYNHQHLDQGSFWLADGGVTFIEERHGSVYYRDPLYASRYTQPIAHSTLLIDGNPQSQRVGDLRGHISGFDDYAETRAFFDTDGLAYAATDLSGVYWDHAVHRDALYVKPNAVVLVDRVTPLEPGRAFEATLLFQTQRLDSIAAGNEVTAIHKEGRELRIHHLHPPSARAARVETPHYLNTLLNENPLVKEGMLTVTAAGEHGTLTFVTLLTTAPDDAVQLERGDEFITGHVNGTPFSVRLGPAAAIHADGAFAMDAFITSAAGQRVFLAGFTSYEDTGERRITTDIRITAELAEHSLRYVAPEATAIRLAFPEPLAEVALDGAPQSLGDAPARTATVAVPAGEGAITWRFATE